VFTQCNMHQVRNADFAYIENDGLKAKRIDDLIPIRVYKSTILFSPNSRGSKIIFQISVGSSGTLFVGVRELCDIGRKSLCDFIASGSQCWLCSVAGQDSKFRELERRVCEGSLG
jgi:hypothetical protein